MPRGELYPALFVSKKWCHLIKDSQFIASRMDKLDCERMILGLTRFKGQFSPEVRKEMTRTIRSINSVRLNSEVSFKELKRFLHPKLIHLNLICMDIDSQDLETLPATLESLIVHKCLIKRVHLETLPRGLESLSIDDNNPNPLPYGQEIEHPESDFEWIPENLKSLSIGKPYKVGSYIISRLPKELKSLSLRFQPTKDSDFSDFPCQLDLKLTHCYAITDVGLSYLSRLKRLLTLILQNLKIRGTTMRNLTSSLTKLIVQNESTAFFNEYGRTLRALTQLVSLILEAYQELPYFSCEDFPKSLVSLNVKFHNDMTQDIPFSISGINRCFKLQHLILEGLHIDDGDLSCLPKSIKNLHLKSCQLARHVNQSLSGLTLLTVLNLNESTGIKQETICSLPPSLTELNL